jgi:hypothetical protein
MSCKSSLRLCLLFGLVFFQYIALAQTERFKGKVKSSMLFSHYADKDKKVHRVINTIETLYDKSGLVVSEDAFFRLGTKETMGVSSRYYYDHNGRKIKTIQSHTINNEGLTGHDTLETTYRINKQGNLVETYYMKVSKGETRRTVYDKARQADTVFESGKLNPVKIVKHVDRFRDEEISFYPEVNNFFSNIRYMSDIPYVTDTNITAHKALIIFDKHHNKTDEILFKHNGERGSHETYIYDDNGNLLKYIDSNRIYIGGAHKNVEKAPYSGSRTYRYTKFDKFGNWQKQYNLIEDKFILVARRKLKYYN